MKVMSNIYVDNVLVGAESTEKAFSVYQGERAMFDRASMNHREWNSNSKDSNQLRTNLMLRVMN